MSFFLSKRLLIPFLIAILATTIYCLINFKLNLFSLAGLLLGAACFILAYLIFAYAKQEMHRVWAIFNLCIGLWGVGTFFVGVSSSESLALIAWKVAYTGVLLLPVFFYHVIYLFCDLKDNKLLQFVYIQGMAVVLLNGTTNYFIGHKLIYLFNSFYYHTVTKVYIFFFVIWIAIVTLAFWKLYEFIKKCEGFRKSQGLYLFWSMLFGFMGGTTVVAPAFGILIYPYGHFFICIYAGISTYAIFRYKLLDIRIVVTRVGLFFAVYSLVLGLPFWLGWRLLGIGKWLVPVFFMAVFATVGPFVYIFIQRRAEERLLAEQRKYQATLRQASAGMGRIRDLKKLLNLIVAILTRVVRIEHVCIYFFDRDTKVYHLSAFRRTNAGEALMAELSTEHSVISRFLSFDAPLVYEEVRQRIEHDKEAEWVDVETAMKELRADLVFPVFIRSKLTAVVVLGKKLNGRAYSEDDLVVFSILANQASLAIENALSYEDMKKTQEQLFKADKMATIGTMADGLSHQINNRLHAMGFIASDMLDTLKMRRPLFTTPELKAVADEFEYSLSRVQENVTRGGDIVQGLMKYTRKGEEGFLPCNIDDVVRTSYEMAQFKIRSAEFKIIKEYDPQNIPKVKGNFTQLQEVFFNLIDNAYDATVQRKAEVKEEGYVAQLKVSVKEMDGWVEMIFSDNGMGVKPVDKDKLFTPFFTTKATSKKGTGLGLYVIRKIIEDNHGGKVEMRSVYGQGTDMVLRLAVSKE